MVELDFLRIEAELSRVLDRVYRALSPEQLAGLRDLNHAGEPGVALEILCDQLLEVDARVAASVWQDLRRLSEEMRIDRKYCDRLQPLVRQDWDPHNPVMPFPILEPADLDVQVSPPTGLLKVVEQNLTDLAPWHILPRELARERLRGLRQRYHRKYVPFAGRQDNDDIATTLPGAPDRVVVVHDFASEGSEVVAEYESFWDWFRAAVEEMIAFE